jgi:hypothetical protein
MINGFELGGVSVMVLLRCGGEKWNLYFFLEKCRDTPVVLYGYDTGQVPWYSTVRVYRDA